MREIRASGSVGAREATLVVYPTAAKPINRGARSGVAIRLRQLQSVVVHAVRQESLAEEDVMA